MPQQSRTRSFFVILIIYILAFAVGAAAYRLANGTALWRMFLADLAATLLVWLFGIFYKNSSVYDPYWSVAPLAVYPAWMILRGGPIAFSDLLLLAAVLVWGIRLTLNWAVRFDGLHAQDWRYTMYKEDSPKFWFITNLFGINIMPTVLVFGGMLPAYFAIMNPGGPNLLSFAGFVICVAAAGVQLISDTQMQQFKKSGGAGCIEAGLWRVSRHPNYLGEVSFWWGMYIILLGLCPKYWYTLAGPLAITLLFVFVSIPLMEKHVIKTRPDYLDYQRKVPALIPRFKKS